MAFFSSLIERREFSLARFANWMDSLYGGMPSDSGIPVDATSALKWAAVWAAVLVKSQDGARTPLNTYRRLGKNGDDGREPARNHSLWTLFRVSANAYMSAYVYRQTMGKHLNVCGNAYSLIDRDGAGDVIGLWPRSPHHMRPEINKGVLRYLYTNSNGATEEYAPEQVFHLRGLSDDGIVGLAPIDIHRDTIGLGLARQKHSSMLFKNGASPKWHIEFDKEVGPDKALEAMAKFRATYGGVENTGKIMGLFGGMTLKSLGFTNEQIQYIESEHLGVEDCCRIWRIPPTKLMDFLRATYSNVTETNIAYVNDSLRPDQENWEQEIHLKLLRPEERETYYVEHDNYDLLKGTPKERAEIEGLYVDKGISNINEVRRSHNWNPVAGGDKNRTQMQNVPLESADQLAMQPKSQPADKKGAQQ